MYYHYLGDHHFQSPYFCTFYNFIIFGHVTHIVWKRASMECRLFAVGAEVRQNKRICNTCLSAFLRARHTFYYFLLFFIKKTAKKVVHVQFNHQTYSSNSFDAIRYFRELSPILYVIFSLYSSMIEARIKLSCRVIC